jgi:hypothetical protein
MRTRRFGFMVLPAMLALVAGVSPAGATVTVGQVAPTTPTPVCASPVDRVQPSISSGNSYVMPANGTITSWSTNAGASSGQLKLKVFRLVSGTTYMAVGQDGPRDLTLNSLNTFASNVAVKAGDLVGLNSFSGSPNCSFEFLGDSYLRVPTTGDLANGESADFSLPVTDRHLNISGALEPTNTLTFGAIVRNKKKGTATLTVNVPNGGQLASSTKGVSLAQAAAVNTLTAAGPVKVKVKAKGKKLAKLNETGKVKVSPSFTFTPTGGTANTQSTKVKLKKLI